VSEVQQNVYIYDTFNSSEPSKIDEVIFLSSEDLKESFPDPFDVVLQKKIQSFPVGTKYRDIVLSYFQRLQGHASTTAGYIPNIDRYGVVSDYISQLWLDSSKNPSIFKTSRDFEPILKRIPYYRDHFIHSFNVFTLGYYIINRTKAVLPSFDFKSNAFNLTWMLASTFHDVAYPMQKMENWLNELFDKFLGVNPRFHYDITQVIPMIYTDFLKMISRWHKQPLQGPLGTQDLLDLDWTFYDETCAKLVEKDHGVLGGLMLAHLLAVKEGFAGERTWDFLFNHLPACHSICVHNLSSLCIGFRKHPLAFLLILCDEMQEWGRPSKLENMDNIRLLDVDVSLEGERIVVTFDALISHERQKLLRKELNRHIDTDGRIGINIINRIEPENVVTIDDRGVMIH